MGFPIFTERARELILGAQEDLRDAIVEVDDAEAQDVMGEVIVELDRLLDWEDLS